MPIIYQDDIPETYIHKDELKKLKKWSTGGGLNQPIVSMGGSFLPNDGKIIYHGGSIISDVAKVLNTTMNTLSYIDPTLGAINFLKDKLTGGSFLPNDGKIIYHGGELTLDHFRGGNLADAETLKNQETSKSVANEIINKTRTKKDLMNGVGFKILNT